MVRTTIGGFQRYIADNVPTSLDALPDYLRRELEKIQSAINTLADGQLDVTTVAPIKPRDGMLRRADGTSWNPGSGQGVYCYYNAAWHFLG